MPFVYDFSLNDNTLPRVKRETAVGSVTDTHTGVRLDSRGHVCFRLPAAERERILELRELHRREDAAFCYTVSVNGRHIYTRSYEPLANAPVSVFIRLPDDLPIDGEAEIGMENISSSPVCLWDARLHDQPVVGQPPGAQQGSHVGGHSFLERWEPVSPAVADVSRGNLRLLLSGPKSSAGRSRVFRW